MYGVFAYLDARTYEMRQSRMPPHLLPQSFFEASHHGKSLAFQIYMLCQLFFFVVVFFIWFTAHLALALYPQALTAVLDYNSFHYMLQRISIADFQRARDGRNHG